MTEPRRKCIHGRRNTKENQGVNIVTQGQRKANESTKGKDLHMDREKPMKVPWKKFTHGQRNTNEITKEPFLYMDREQPRIQCINGQPRQK